jgi:hypothetical protein
MMRPKRVGAGADHELVVGLVGARAVLDDLGDLLAWLTADAGGGVPSAKPSELVDALLGLVAIAAAIDRWPADPFDPHASCGLRETHDRDPTAPAGAPGTEDLLR